MNSLLSDFVLEARELLEDTNANLLALEKDPNNAEVVNTTFRAMHTLKGDSGLVDLPDITRLLHAAEDVLDQVRENTLPLSGNIIDILLQVADCVGGWLDHLDSNECLPQRAGDQSTPLIAQLRSFLSASESEVAPPESIVAVEPALCTWITSIPSDVRDSLRREIAETNETLIAIDYRPEEDCFFRGEDPFFLMQQIEETRWRCVSTPSELPSPGNLDPFRCLLTFQAISFASRDAIEDLFRYVLPQVQIVTVSAEMLEIGRDAKDDNSQSSLRPSALIGRGISMNDQRDLKQFLRQLAVGIQTPGDSDILTGRLSSTASILQNCAVYLGASELAEPIAEALKQSLDARAAGPLCRQISSLLTELNRDEPLRISDIAPEMAAGNASPDEETTGGPKPGVIRVLKVDQARIDRLMDLIGEMVVAKNSLPYLAERADVVFGMSDLSREIKEHYRVINRITQDMQDAIMEVRMLPVSHVLQRFPRLVRDTARKLGKDIDLVLEGDDTELDKNIVEALGDPLMHIVRNSLDHGLETPDDRIAAGKIPKGTIRIRASQENGRALIEVCDDGRGIDPDRVKRKALERRLIPNEEAMLAMSDQDAVQLVFQAGFSTVEQISDLSGRGVGMDVVRSAVEHAGGTVQLTSVKGTGTTVSLSLPMTMTSTRAMVVKADNQSFGVPLDIITETFRVPKESLFRIKHKEVLVRRNCTMPVVRLRRVLGLAPDPEMDDDEEYAVLMARIFGESVALLVDDFADIVEVILKPMEGVVSGSKGFASTAILGNGSILLMLDLEGLI